MGLLCERAGRFTAKNVGFRRGQTAAMLVCRGLGFPCAAEGCAAVCNTDVGTEDFLIDDVVCADPAAFDLNGPKTKFAQGWPKLRDLAQHFD